jgi:hypothetical protein
MKMLEMDLNNSLFTCHTVIIVTLVMSINNSLFICHTFIIIIIYQIKNKENISARVINRTQSFNLYKISLIASFSSHVQGIPVTFHGIIEISEASRAILRNNNGSLS